MTIAVDDCNSSSPRSCNTERKDGAAVAPDAVENDNAGNADDDRNDPSTGEEEEDRIVESCSCCCACWRDYWNIVVLYPKFRAILLSRLLLGFGVWFVRIPSIVVVEEWTTDPTGGTDQTGDIAGIALLFFVIHFPAILFSPIGGTLADAFDRRKTMVLLDVVSGCTILLFLVAYRCDQIVYAVRTVKKIAPPSPLTPVYNLSLNMFSGRRLIADTRACGCSSS